MLIKSYKPSKKGLNHFRKDYRISVVDEYYLWYKIREDGTIYFDSGDFPKADVFEYKGHMKRKPDSFWILDSEIEFNDIENYDIISEDNLKECKWILNKLKEKM